MEYVLFSLTALLALVMLVLVVRVIEASFVLDATGGRMKDIVFEDLYNAAASDGWLSRAEAELLVEEAVAAGGRLVEFGSYKGRSATFLGRVAAASGHTLWCVDPWDDSFSDTETGDEIFAQFWANVSGLPVAVERKRVEDWVPCEATFVYCDGDHSYDGTVAQLRKAVACKPKVIAVHDYRSSGGGAEVKRACSDVLGPPHELVESLAVWRLR